MTENGGSPDRGRADGDDTEDPAQRDLGLGHPLSPEASAPDSPRTGSDTDREETGEGTNAPRLGDDGEKSTYSRRDLLLGGVAASLGWGGVLASSGGDSPDGAEAAAADYIPNAVGKPRRLRRGGV